MKIFLRTTKSNGLLVFVSILSKFFSFTNYKPFYFNLQTIHGVVLFMDLEQHLCIWDWLEITSRFKMIGRFCGTEQVHFQSDDMVLLTFQSDSVVSKAGFSLSLTTRGGFTGFVALYTLVKCFDVALFSLF